MNSFILSSAGQPFILHKGRGHFKQRETSFFASSSVNVLLISSNVMIVTKAIERCLWLFTTEEWENMSAKLMANASPFSEQNRIIMRRFIAPAQEIEFDKSGRLSIPQSLREYASLSKDCIFLGEQKFIELWDAQSYESYMAETEDKLLEASEQFKNISF